MPLVVRPATAGDGPAVVALWRVCGLVIPENDPAADFAFARAGACSDVLVGVDTAGLRGGVMVGHDGHRGWLYYLAVDPSAQGAGIGRRMVEAAEDWLRRRGLAKAQLLVRDTNAGVVGFYERLGFAVAPRVVMAKRL